ncbi:MULTISPECIES: hypothetical protein [Haloferacaceae]|uniref:Uncharacterized protein n=1 Tax=Halorubrum glutamatedens TaxID=2707018 RepID=A0ABD5QTL0_9EURY|nr:hypothetical protein [Halobellus captivus]
MAVASGPFCGALGCRDEADHVIRLEDGRERPTCASDARDGTVIRDV